MIRLVLPLMLLTLCACEPEKRATTLASDQTPNGWRVQTLFEHDGCTAYYADGYLSGFDGFKYVVCDGGRPTHTEWEEERRSGKFIHHYAVDVDTVTR